MQSAALCAMSGVLRRPVVEVPLPPWHDMAPVSLLHPFRRLGLRVETPALSVVRSVSSAPMSCRPAAKAVPLR